MPWEWWGDAQATSLTPIQPQVFPELWVLGLQELFKNSFVVAKLLYYISLFSGK